MSARPHKGVEATGVTDDAPARAVEVVFNSASGAGDKEEERARLVALFKAHGMDARVTPVSDGEEIVEAARRATSAGASLVVAGGGDGTASAVAAALVEAESEAAFGVLPLGTLNHFAKDLGVPLDLEEAVRNFAEGRAARVDVGEVNGRIFLNNSSLGLYPSIVRRRERQQERLGRGKWPAFLLAVLSVFRLYPFLRVRLSADGHEFWRKTPFVFIGNNEYQMESLQIGGRECLDAGHLSLYVTHRTGRLGLVWLALRALFGRLRDAKDFDAVCAKEIVVETRRPKRVRVATDGEVTIMQTPLRYRVRPGALRVIVPKEVNSES